MVVFYYKHFVYKHVHLHFTILQKTDGVEYLIMRTCFLRSEKNVTFDMNTENALNVA